MARIFLMMIVIAGTFLVSAPVQADPRGWFGRFVNGLFGEYHRGPSPEATGVAPFIVPTFNASSVLPLTNPEGGMPLDRPHLDDTALSAWAMDQVVIALTMAPADTTTGGKKAAAQRSEQMTRNFAESGRIDLATFLGQLGVPQGLVAQNKKLLAYTDAIPSKDSVKNQGVFSNVYRWLVDVPVTVSVLPQGQKTYRGMVPGSTGVSHTYTVRVQIGRVVGSADHPGGMVIERFTVLPPSS